MKKETIEKVLTKLKSLKLSMIAHPDYEHDSEFGDRVTDLEEIEVEIAKSQEERSYGEEDVIKIFYDWYIFDYHQESFSGKDDLTFKQ